MSKNSSIVYKKNHPHKVKDRLGSSPSLRGYIKNSDARERRGKARKYERKIARDGLGYENFIAMIFLNFRFRRHDVAKAERVDLDVLLGLKTTLFAI